MFGEPPVAYDIAFVGRVLPAVDFYDQPPRPTHKIDDVRPDRFLTNEFTAVNRTSAQPIPEFEFSLRRLKAKAACTFARLYIRATHAELPPHPTCFAPQMLRSQVDLSPHA